jgi:hypothetical protein
MPSSLIAATTRDNEDFWRLRVEMQEEKRGQIYFPRACRKINLTPFFRS